MGDGGPGRRRPFAVLRRLLGHGPAVAGAAVLALLVLVALLGDALARYPHDRPTADLSRPPSWEHWFGTDTIGLDLFALVVEGLRTSLQVAVVVVVVSTLVGAVVGALAGFLRGWVDAVLMRLTDLFLTIPVLAVLLVVASRYRAQRGNLLLVALVIAAFAWMPLARAVRGVAASVRERPFVEAARALGASPARVLVRHVLPHCLAPILVHAALVVSTAVLAEAALSFLGFGVSPPDTSLGRLVADGAGASRTRWWLFYPPGLVLVVLVLCVHFVADGLQEAFGRGPARGGPGRDHLGATVGEGRVTVERLAG